MLVVALTGGIGSGKSTVAKRLAAHGIPIIDADVLARALVAPGNPASDEIRQAFGAQVFSATGELDRARLRRQVFADPAARERLEAILHPRIRQRMRQRLAELSAPYAVLVIPLLLETGQSDLADRVLVVDSPEPLQIARVQARNGLATAEIERIIAAQCPRVRRLAAADDVITNDGSLEDLLDQTDRAHQRYLLIADTSET